MIPLTWKVSWGEEIRKRGGDDKFLFAHYTRERYNGRRIENRQRKDRPLSFFSNVKGSFIKLAASLSINVLISRSRVTYNLCASTRPYVSSSSSYIRTCSRGIPGTRCDRTFMKRQRNEWWSKLVNRCWNFTILVTL